MNEEDLKKVLEVPHYLREWLHSEEIYLALVTGTRPVYFQETADSFIWGSGSLFMLRFAGYDFALTARHVFTKSGANPQHTRILFPGSRVAVPLAGGFFAEFEGHENQEDLEDMCLLYVDKGHPAWDDPEFPEYPLWRFEDFWVPAWLLEEGEQVFAVGYPTHEEKFDYDNNKIRELPLVAVGKLRKGNGKGLFKIDCAEFEDEIAGCSGGPVFARVKGHFVFIGMMIRGGAAARTIHFVDSQHVYQFLKNAVTALEAKKD